MYITFTTSKVVAGKAIVLVNILFILFYFFFCLADLEVLYHSDLSFSERIYGPLDVDVCRIKLHEPLSIIVQQPLLYVRDMVPKACFEALVKLEQVRLLTDF